MAKNSEFKPLAQEIYQYLGGMANVESLNHCMTRLRIKVKDMSLIDIDSLKKIKGVLGVIEDDTLQIVIGPGKVNKVATLMVEMAGVGLGEPFPEGIKGDDSSKDNLKKVQEVAEAVKANQKSKINEKAGFRKFLKHIANIFVPLIPAFVGAGILGGVGAIISNMIEAGDLNSDWQIYADFFNILKSGIFSFLPIFVGINTAKEFGANQSLGGAIGAITMLPGLSVGGFIPNIFLSGTNLASGQGGVIGVILAVWVLSIIEKKLHQIIPDSLDIIIVPTLSLLVTGLLTLFLFMPIAGFISAGLVESINFILEKGGAFAGFVLGSLFLPMVMLGLHQVLLPIHIELINSMGMSVPFAILAMAGGGQVGAAFALWIRLRKDKDLVELIKGALPVGILGIGEPLIYGVTLPLGRPFLTACLGGGVGGAVIGYLGNVGATAIGPSGMALLPLIHNGQWVGYLVGLFSAYIAGFIFTFFFGIPEDRLKGQGMINES